MSNKPILEDSSLGQIAINVSDIRRAISFYKDTLGFKFLFDAGTMAFFDCGGIRLMLGVAEKPEFDHPSSILYFKVNGVADYHERLTKVGVEFAGAPHLAAPMPDHDLWMAFFRDSEGNMLALMSEEPKAK